MNPIEITVPNTDEKVTLHCTHAEEWPPTHVKLSRSIEDQRASGFIDEAKYQQILVYKRVCGLLDMEEGKCSECPLALHEVNGRKVKYRHPGNASTRNPYFARSKQNVG